MLKQSSAESKGLVYRPVISCALGAKANTFFNLHPNIDVLVPFLSQPKNAAQPSSYPLPFFTILWLFQAVTYMIHVQPSRGQLCQTGVGRLSSSCLHLNLFSCHLFVSLSEGHTEHRGIYHKATLCKWVYPCSKLTPGQTEFN